MVDRTVVIHKNTVLMSISATARRTPSEALRQVFGFDQFRPHQQGLVDGLLAGQDVFGVMPTGGGKSLCYQLPAVVMSGCAVVVSPLIALMKDQVDAARANGIRAACVNSAASQEERVEAARAYRAGELDLLYVAPERLCLNGFLDKLRNCPTKQPAFFAIDEAHCLSEWGHDFRPDYLFLSTLKNEFPQVPVAAFTATATHQVAEDIEKRLNLKKAVKVRASFDRKNLHYQVRAKKDWERQLVEFIKARPDQCGIVYRTSRKSVEATAALLRANGVDAQAYHAGMDNDDRSRVQEGFLRDDCRVIVATVAFGMGIDKPDVRYVVHGDLPKNLESYYQETGRAGRDGEPSQCLLLYSPADAFKIVRFFDEIEDERERERNRALLRSMEEFASVPTCRRAALLGYFGEKVAEENCGACDFCDGHFEFVDATRDARIVLSAIARTGERFGAVHLCDIVIGANTKKIRECGHDQLKTYGAGKDQAKNHWRSILDALISGGIVQIPTGDYAVPKLTPQAWKILKGEEKFSQHRDQRIEPEKKASRSAGEEDFPFHQGLFEHLRQVRKKLADARSVPPFVVAGDRTLRQMAALMPLTDSAMLKIHGMGQKKYDEFGEDFLLEIGLYLKKYPEIASERLAALPNQGELKREVSGTYLQTLELLRKNITLAQIAKQRGMAQGTIETHVAKLIEVGMVTDHRKFVSEENEIKIRELIENKGPESLGAIFKAAGEKIPYGEIRIVLACMAAE